MIREFALNTLESAIHRIAGGAPANRIPFDIRKLIAAEANAIDTIMRDLSVFAWVADSEIVVCPAGGFIRYTIETGDGTRAGSVKTIASDIEIAVNRARQRLIGGEHIPLVWNRGLSFDMPYPGERELVLWNEITETKSLRNMQMVVGRDYSGYKPFTRTLTFGNGETTHIFVGGGTGSGKTVGISNLIASLCLGTSPADLQVIVLDTKHCKDLALVGGFPQVTIHNDPADCLAALQSIFAEMQRRQREGGDDAKIVVVLEELLYLMELSGAKDLINSILNSMSATARAAGIHMIACTQYPNKDILNRSFMVNFDVKICGSFGSQQAMRQVLDIEDFTGAILPGRGAFYIASRGLVSRVQSSALFGEYLLDVVAEAKMKWQGVEPYRMPMGEISTLAEKEPNPDQHALNQLMFHYAYDELFDADGTLLEINMSEVIRYTLGRSKRNTGRTTERMRRVLDRAATMRDQWVK